uniref:Uncharacterized protein n=1 Tax=Kryptolebias marmoratus TaxID=37003 RepID=A0A3Q2ZQ94_KRYMA
LNRLWPVGQEVQDPVAEGRAQSNETIWPHKSELKEDFLEINPSSLALLLKQSYQSSVFTTTRLPFCS